MASIETDKVNTDLFFPISGKLIEVNPKLLTEPTLINDSAFKEGQLLKLEAVPKTEIESLMDAKEYQNFLGTFFNKNEEQVVKSI